MRKKTFAVIVFLLAIASFAVTGYFIFSPSSSPEEAAENLHNADTFKLCAIAYSLLFWIIAKEKKPAYDYDIEPVNELEYQ